MIKRLHKHPDGIWRSTPVINATGLRLTKLNADGRPTGETVEMVAVCSVSFDEDGWRV